MAEYVLTEDRGDVALITLNRPPANALTTEVRRALEEHLTSAFERPEIVGVVLRGQGAVFSSGIEITEFDATLSAPWVGDLCALIESSEKPVICALHGQVLGAAFELALAAHGRVAAADTRLAMPDVRLGMVPGSGGTQRLPRLLGAQRSIELLMSGRAIEAKDSRMKRLIQTVTQGDPTEAAIPLARELATLSAPPRTCDIDAGFSDPVAYQGAVFTVLKTLKRTDTVEADILRCIEAAQLLPFDQGVLFEQTLFEERLQSRTARGMRHFLTAEHVAAQFPKGAQPQALEQVAVIGTDGLAVEAASIAMEHGGRVMVLGADDQALTAFKESVRHLLNAISPQAVQENVSRLQSVTQAEHVAQADLILDTGQGALAGISKLKQDAIWAKLRPDIPASRIGDRLSAAQSVELHLHRPLHRKRLVELAAAHPILPGVLASLQSFFAKRGTTLLRCKPPAGYLGNRLTSCYELAACKLVNEGASPYAVDDAARAIGFGKGPFAMMDEEGLRHVVNRLLRHAESRKFAEVDPALIQSLADRGRHGRAASRGVYIYTTEGAQSDPVVDELVAEVAVAMRAAKLNQPELGAALHSALVNEAVTLLAEGAAQRASDLDLVMVRLLGFDQSLGGPLLQADIDGIFPLYQAMQRLETLSPLWAAHPVVVEMIKNGKKFFGH